MPIRLIEEEIRTREATAIVMDIEGAEVEVLRHCQDFGGIRAIACELHPHLTGDREVASMREALGTHGFRTDPALSMNKVEVFVRRV